jgi:hypothetical protein
MKIILADSHGTVMGKDQTSTNLSLLYLGAYLKSKIPEVDLTYIPQVKSENYHRPCLCLHKQKYFIHLKNGTK